MIRDVSRNHVQGAHPGRGRIALVLAVFWCAGMSSGCASVPKVGTSENQLSTTARRADAIHWPPAYDPADAGFFVHNVIDIEAPPRFVWDVLIQAETWPTWYEGAQDVEVVSAKTGKLAPNAVFTWTTMDLDFTSTVTEFEPPYRLSWESRKSTIQGYHAWLVIPTKTGCRLVTDESQHGFLTVMQSIFVPNKLRELHDVWLRAIKAKAEAEYRRLK